VVVRVEQPVDELAGDHGGGCACGDDGCCDCGDDCDCDDDRDD
jgi:hypothetical protein